ncbi:alpha/beta fold hydrolase [Kitasatospora viridis]|uniref:Pimeloyl-ACP methyl ester carboxylesterase n=1 Tax=Kitasatospora viridis TaxID=281105 RepID=A0A561UQ82_9ACTN|nr:alpha/beta hydrolase [Kitasatospora viridis]TWG01520.1 pimeloyl-ACP methyl ester carboxylesterase [Kitasatospora viridis]
MSELRVPGATLHYQVHGAGPVLLLIPGGTGGAAGFTAVLDRLTVDHTVLTYDPRGIGRSPLDEADAEQRVAEHAEDAARLLDLVAPGEPVRVFGASSGAIVALHLACVEPGRVARVVAHEPPLVEVLPDAGAQRAMVAGVREVWRSEGVPAAVAALATGLSRDGKPVQVGELPPRLATAMGYFVGRIVPSFMVHRPDLGRLASLGDRVVPAVGAESHGELPCRAAESLAARLGREPVLFPGGHVGLSTHPAEFGDRLRQVLTA